MSWGMVDEGWGRAVREFAALSEPQNCREYVAVHQRLGVAAGDRVLDVACGSAPTIASTGPAYLAIQEIGLEEFLRRAEELASPLVREGLPLRGEVDVIAFFGTRRT